MKKYNIINCLSSKLPFLLAFLFFFTTLQGFAQDAEEEETETEENSVYKTTMRLSYIKRGDDTKMLLANLTYKIDKDKYNLSGFEVAFTMMQNDEKIDLGTAFTNENGDAFVYISPDYQLFADTFFVDFNAKFAGNDTLKRASKSATIYNSRITTDFIEEDSLRFVKVKVIGVTEETGDTVDIEEVAVMILVKRLHSEFLVGEEELSGGRAKIEFPFDLPGDSIGNLIVTARIEDHELYGTIESTQIIQWGTPVSYNVEDLPPTLWTDEAPAWMLITFWIIIFGVWIHFFWAIVKVVKLSKLGKVHQKL